MPHSTFKCYHYMLTMKFNIYNMCHNENIHIRRANHKFAQMCIRHNVPILINNSDESINDEFHTHTSSLQGFARYVKSRVVQRYIDICVIRNCYICSRENVWVYLISDIKSIFRNYPCEIWNVTFFSSVTGD